MGPENGASRSHLGALTGLRFIAALQVVIFDCTAWDHWPVGAPIRNIAGAGYAAASLFFDLSGFILTYEHAGPGAAPIGRRDFYENRFARIYPAYAFALLIIAPLFAAQTLKVQGVRAFLEQAIAVVLLVQAYVPSLATAWNPPAWSLSVEVFFYALFPFVAPRLSRCRRSTALAVAAGGYGVCLLLPVAYRRLGLDAPVPPTKDSHEFWLGVLRYGPLVRFPEFVIGIVAGRWFLDMGPPRASTGWATLSIAALGVLVATLAVSPAIPYPVLHSGLLAPVFALLILSLAAGGGPLASLLSTRPFVALGGASYSLCVLHVPLLILWSKAAVHIGGAAFFGTAPSTAILVALAIGASLLCNRYVERPLRVFTLAVLRGERSLRSVWHGLAWFALVSVSMVAVALLVEHVLEVRDAARLTADDTFYPIHGKPVRYKYTGAGKPGPTVVLIPGMTADMDQYYVLQPALSATSRVVTYDRGGMGFGESDAHDASKQADELADFLHFPGANPPYLFVGYSTGALVLRIFFSRHPELVAGIVFLDPLVMPEAHLKEAPETHVSYDQRFRKIWFMVLTSLVGYTRLTEFLAHRHDPPMTLHEQKIRAAAVSAHFWWAAAEDSLTIERSCAEVLAIPVDFEDVPVGLLSTIHPDNDEDGVLRYDDRPLLRDETIAFVHKAVRGEFRLLPENCHHVKMISDPMCAPLIVDFIRETVDRARTPTTESGEQPDRK